MKKNSFWFTFVEMIVVIFIISITWVVAMNSLFSSFDKQVWNIQKNEIINFINSFDNKLWKNITDYELIFSWWLDYLIYKTNNNYKSGLVSYSFSWYTWTFTNTVSWTLIEYYFYNNNKLINKDISSRSWAILNYDFSILKWNSYIKTFVDSKRLNDIWVYFFSSDDKNPLFIKEIKNWNSTLTWITIKKSIWWNKIIQQNWNNISSWTIIFDTKYWEFNINIP